MHTFFKKFLVALAVIFSVAGTLSLVQPTPVHAARSMGSCDNSFFGLTNWDCGFEEFVDNDPDNQDRLVKNAIIIASNILVDLTVIASYLVIGYVIYGGYLYILSNGESGKVAAGKNTLTHAFIGLAIVMLSNVIFNTARIALLGSSGAFTKNCALASSNCVTQAALVTNLLNWVIGAAGAVALGFVFIGGIGYLTSSGDAAKLQKAKNTITYSLIGLAIVALSMIITAFVSNIIRDADTPTSYHQQLIIAKESYEI